MTADRIAPADARMKQREGATIIDVREPADYAAGHIAGAVNIPIGDLATAELPDGLLLTACGGGGRAGRAAEALVEAGRDAASIAGGTRAWRELGLPIEAPL